MTTNIPATVLLKHFRLQPRKDMHIHTHTHIVLAEKVSRKQYLPMAITFSFFKMWVMTYYIDFTLKILPYRVFCAVYSEYLQ